MEKCFVIAVLCSLFVTAFSTWMCEDEYHRPIQPGQSYLIGCYECICQPFPRGPACWKRPDYQEYHQPIHQFYPVGPIYHNNAYPSHGNVPPMYNTYRPPTQVYRPVENVYPPNNNVMFSPPNGNGYRRPRVIFYRHPQTDKVHPPIIDKVHKPMPMPMPVLPPTEKLFPPKQIPSVDKVIPLQPMRPKDKVIPTTVRTIIPPFNLDPVRTIPQ